MVLLQLPEDLCRELLSEWVLVKELMSLDIAFPTRNRLQYHGRIKGLSTTNTHSRRVNEWMHTRSIKTREFHLFDSMIALGRNHRITFHVDFEGILVLNTTHVLTTDVTFVIINRCINLRTLITCGGNLNIKAIDKEILAGLTGLYITSPIAYQQDDSLILIRDHCIHLKEFSYPEAQSKCDELVIDIIAAIAN